MGELEICEMVRFRKTDGQVLAIPIAEEKIINDQSVMLLQLGHHSYFSIGSAVKLTRERINSFVAQEYIYRYGLQ